MVKRPADDGIKEPTWDAPEEEWVKALTELQDWLQRELDKDGGKEIGYVEYLAPHSATNRCIQPPIGCGKIAIRANTPFNKALIPGHVYSEAGERELKRVSHLCEWCFDVITQVTEADQEDAAFGRWDAEEAEEQREADELDRAEKQRELRDEERLVSEMDFEHLDEPDVSSSADRMRGTDG